MGEPATGSRPGGRAAGPAAALGNRAAERDWGLFQDWCTATDRTVNAADAADLAAFITELPAKPAILHRRLQHIQTRLGLIPAGLPRPVVVAPARPGPPWPSYTDALAALRHEWYPDGIAARRDALILVLTAHGFTRNRIRRLQPSDITTFPAPVVDGLDLPEHPNPALCARCALTRWLAILDAYRDRARRDIEEFLTDARNATARARHDCRDHLGDGWNSAPAIIPAIDRHGAIAPTSPVTGRALTGILTRRFTRGPASAEPAPLLEPAAALPIGQRPSREDLDTIGDLYEQVETQADELNARIQALLADLE